MDKFTGLHEISSSYRNCALTIGNFDGLHRGHQQLIERLLSDAKTRRVRSLLLTFDPHPNQVLRPDKEFTRLFSREDLFQQLQAQGVDGVVCIPFTRELSTLPGSDFLSEYVFQPISPSLLVVGHDFSFGADRLESIDRLNEISKAHDANIEIVPPFSIEGKTVSSTLIRNLLSLGDVNGVQRFLGRSFYVCGVIEEGKKRGRTLGFPTANIIKTNYQMPANGVYITRTRVGKDRFLSVTNIGHNPTFQEGQERAECSVETHIIHKNMNLYGQKIYVHFVKRIRKEMKFDGKENLIKQIQKDIEQAKAWEAAQHEVG